MTTTTTEQGATCMDLCLSDCDDEDEDSYCGSSKHRSACGRCTKHNCDERCEAKCGDANEQKKVTSATECSATCTNACSASCTAKVNTQCQVDCQESTYTSCEQKMVETCQTNCMDKGGAIFCDGQFVNASNAQSCADEIKAKIDIDIDVKGAVEDVGDTVSGAADKACDSVDKCSVREAGAGTGSAWSVLCPLGAFALWRLRRQRPRR